MTPAIQRKVIFNKIIRVLDSNNSSKSGKIETKVIFNEEDEKTLIQKIDSWGKDTFEG